MNNEDLFNRLTELNNSGVNRFAEAISTHMQGFENKEQRLYLLNNLDKVHIPHLKTVYKIAIEKEDYETCDAIKDFFKEKGISSDL